MQTGNICIRKAQPADAEDIFWLLHSESIPWDSGRIMTEIDNLYVMTCEGRHIGACCLVSRDSRVEFHWTAIHPMYPEGALSGIMHNAILNINSNPSSLRLKFC